MTELPPLTLVIGGASSGKSSFAEAFVKSDARRRFYIATAQPFDPEMTAKIAAHKSARASDGWTTVETPMDLSGSLKTLPPDCVTLIDCATLWLTNLMMAEADIAASTDTLFDALAAHSAPVVIVSNEVGHGIVPDNRLGRQFRDAQGALNAKIAARADLVVQVTVGLPRALKGALPEGVW